MIVNEPFMISADNRFIGRKDTAGAGGVLFAGRNDDNSS